MGPGRDPQPPVTIARSPRPQLPLNLSKIWVVLFGSVSVGLQPLPAIGPLCLSSKMTPQAERTPQVHAGSAALALCHPPYSQEKSWLLSRSSWPLGESGRGCYTSALPDVCGFEQLHLFLSLLEAPCGRRGSHRLWAHKGQWFHAVSQSEPCLRALVEGIYGVREATCKVTSV